MAVDPRIAKAKRLAEKMSRRYGDRSAIAGRSDKPKEYWSTGVLSLDYYLGTGGVPKDGLTEIYGPPGMGKTTIIGYGIMRSVQEAGGLTAFIATEPRVDEDWMASHGVNPDWNVIFRPNSLDEAFEMMHEIVQAEAAQYIVFDSLAGIASEKELKNEKQQAYGNSGLITTALKLIATPAYKKDIGITFINQVRDKVSGKYITLDSPGGHGPKHAFDVRIMLKSGKERYHTKIPSSESGKLTEDLEVGREVKAVINKNKTAEELGRSASFDFYHVRTSDHPFGVDVPKDVLNCSMFTGVISGAGWLNHPLFPGGKIQGRAKAMEFLRENPKATSQLREEVLAVMKTREAAEAKKKKEVDDEDNNVVDITTNS